MPEDEEQCDETDSFQAELSLTQQKLDMSGILTVHRGFILLLEN